MQQTNIIAFLILFLATGAMPIIGMDAPKNINDIIPAEILRSNVFGDLYPRELRCSAQVCRTWNNIIKNMPDKNLILPIEILRNNVFGSLYFHDLCLSAQACHTWNNIIKTIPHMIARKKMAPLLSKGKAASMRNQNSHAQTLALQYGQQALSPRNRQAIQMTINTFIPVTPDDASDAQNLDNPQLINYADARSLTPSTQAAANESTAFDDSATTPRSSTSTAAVDSPGLLSPRSPTPRSLSSRSLMRSPRPESPIPPYLFENRQAAAGRTSPEPTRSNQTARRKLFTSLPADVGGPSSQIPSDSDSE